MKIYTKTGDNGTTSLIGGKRVQKDHPRIEAYGTVDELISWIGLIRDHLKIEEDRELFLEIEDRLMTAASHLACDDPERSAKLPALAEEDITRLEKAIDLMERNLTPLSSFILPGGHPVSSFCQVARTICRRAERQSLRLSAHGEVPELVIKYLNRLADFMFVYARKTLKDNQGTEVLWKPKL
ncbi:MAG: cob(I)yrinic acid a,c-diamide adenosyltransferase [Bacteroidales bacterium]